MLRWRVKGNNLHESRVMIECGGVWVEIFEQSGAPERRVTKATLAALEEEFAKFLKNPQDVVAAAQIGSREMAIRFAGQDSQPFRLLKGMQPGMYVVLYALNPGEPGFESGFAFLGHLGYNATSGGLDHDLGIYSGLAFARRKTCRSRYAMAGPVGEPCRLGFARLAWGSSRR